MYNRYLGYTVIRPKANNNTLRLRLKVNKILSEENEPEK